MSSSSLKMLPTNYASTNDIFNAYTYKQDLALNNLLRVFKDIGVP